MKSGNLLKVVLVLLVAAAIFALGQYVGTTGRAVQLTNVAAAASQAATPERAAAPVTDPAGTAPHRYAYYPGTEELGKEEIRLIALGTGMPLARRSQAATCWLVELGNGDKFLGPGRTRTLTL